MMKTVLKFKKVTISLLPQTTIIIEIFILLVNFIKSKEGYQQTQPLSSLKRAINKHNINMSYIADTWWICQNVMKINETHP